MAVKLSEILTVESRLCQIHSTMSVLKHNRVSINCLWRSFAFEVNKIGVTVYKCAFALNTNVIAVALSGANRKWLQKSEKTRGFKI